jgi:hypothetical protein
MKYLLVAVLSLCLLAVAFTASDARPYIVISKIAPITIDPAMKYELSEKGTEIVDGLKECAIYGNIIEAEPTKGRKLRKWMQVKDKDRDLGFIEKKAIAKLPKYRKMKAEKYFVKKDTIQLYIVPGRRAFSKKHGGINLPYGTTVIGVGTCKKSRASWTLLRFDNTEGLPIGVGERYGWVRTSSIQRI